MAETTLRWPRRAFAHACVRACAAARYSLSQACWVVSGAMQPAHTLCTSHAVHACTERCSQRWSGEASHVWCGGSLGKEHVSERVRCAPAARRAQCGHTRMQQGTARGQATGGWLEKGWQCSKEVGTMSCTTPARHGARASCAAHYRHHPARALRGTGLWPDHSITIIVELDPSLLDVEVLPGDAVCLMKVLCHLLREVALQRGGRSGGRGLCVWVGCRTGRQPHSDAKQDSSICPPHPTREHIQKPTRICQAYRDSL